MITINLLPEAYRPPKAGSIQQFHRSPLALFLLTGLIGIAAVLAAWSGMNRFRLSRAKEKLQTMAPMKQRVDQLKASIAVLQQQGLALDEADRRRSAWAPRLGALADLTPPGVWFTSLALDGQKLVLDGAVIKRQGEEMTSLNRFVQELKQDPRLAPVIKEVQLGEIRNVQDGEIELMEFTMTCRLANP